MQSHRRCSIVCERRLVCYNCNNRENVSSKSGFLDYEIARVCAAFYSRVDSSVGGQRSLACSSDFKNTTRSSTVRSTFGSSCGTFLLSRWCVVNDDEIGFRVKLKRLQRCRNDCKLLSLFAITNFTFDCNKFFRV